MRVPKGVEVRHQSGCASTTCGRCDCAPKFRASAWDKRRKVKRRKTFKTLAEANAWRSDAQVDLRRGVMAAPASPTLQSAAEAWIAKAKKGSILNKSGRRYKPSTLRGYEQALRDYVLPALGDVKMAELLSQDVQGMIDDLLEGDAELSPSTIRNAILPLRAICRRAGRRGVVVTNPTDGLELPAVTGTRDRVATPAEAASLIDALPAEDQALWATLFYAGPRLGEGQALEHRDIDLERRRIHVRRTWDRVEGAVEPKSRAGARSIPIARVLAPYLAAHDGPAADLVFGRRDGVPFSPSGVVDRAHRIWESEGLTPITPHECRHTFASLMIAAGVNLKALQVFMGHSTITTTLDRYGHLLPGSEDEAADLLDAYIAAAKDGPVLGQSNPGSGPLEQA